MTKLTRRGSSSLVEDALGTGKRQRSSRLRQPSVKEVINLSQPQTLKTSEGRSKVRKREYAPTGRNFKERRPNRLLTKEAWDYLVDQFTAFYMCNEDDLFIDYGKGNYAHRPGYQARQCAIYVAWVCYDTSFEDIGKFFSVTPTVARNAIKVVESWREDHSSTLGEFFSKVENEIIAQRIKANV